MLGAQPLHGVPGFGNRTPASPSSWFHIRFRLVRYSDAHGHIWHCFHCESAIIPTAALTQVKPCGIIALAILKSFERQLALIVHHWAAHGNQGCLNKSVSEYGSLPLQQYRKSPPLIFHSDSWRYLKVCQH